MKNLIILVLLIGQIPLLSQNNWVELKIPQSGIIGRKVQSFSKGGDIKFEPQTETVKIESYNEFESADLITDYRKKVGDFFSTIFTRNALKVKDVTVKKLVVKSLDVSSIKKLSPGALYVYEGLSADTVTVIFTSSRGNKLDLKELEKIVAASLLNGSTELVDKVIPILKDVSYDHQDSTQYKLVISNPNVYYKVRIVEYKNVDFEFKWLPFLTGKENIKTKSTTVLKADPSGLKSKTAAIYPLFKNGQHDRSVQFRFEAINEKNELKLVLMGKGLNTDGNWEQLVEIPKVSDDIWRMDRRLITSFYRYGTTKKIYIQCVAKKKGDDEIEIINWEGNRKVLDNNYTYMQYPEVKFIYK